MPKNKTDFFEKILRKDILLIILIAGAGTLLRIVFLNARSLTFDEGASLMFTKASLPDMIQGTMADVHPPLYFLILHFWAKINSSLIFLRFLSTIFGIASIFLMGFVGKKFFGSKVGILVTLITALSPAFIFESTNLRMYSLGIFESILILYFFFQFLKNQNLFNSLGLLLSTIFGFYTHYYFALAAINLNIFILLNYARDRKILRVWFWLQACLIISSLPLIFGYFQSAHPQLFPAPNSLLKIPGVFASFIISWDALQILKIYPFIALNTLFLSYVSLVFIFSFFFLYGLKNSKKNSLFFSLSLYYLFFPIFFVAFYSFFVKPIFGLRSFIIFSVPFYSLVALGLSKLKGSFFKVSLFLLATLFLLLQYQGFQNSWQSVAPYYFVKENVQEGDLVAYSDPSLLIPGRYYLEHQENFALVPTWLSPETAEALGYKEKELKNLQFTSSRLWYFLLEPQYFNGDLAQKKQKELETDYLVILSKNYKDLNLRITLFDLTQKSP